jgi:hypothetical protein
VAGTYALYLANGASNRGYVSTVSVTTSWTQVSFTLTGDTAGTWLTNNGIGLYLGVDLGCGSAFKAPSNNSWQAGDYKSATGAVVFVNQTATTSTFQITGVQLEKGSTATSFDYRPYGTELQLAQRYFQKSYSIGIAVGSATAVGQLTTRIYNTDVYLPAVQQRLPVTMRSSPTVTWYTTAGVSGSLNIGAGTNTINTPFDINESSTGWLYVNGAVASGDQVGGQYTASAEL